MLYKRCYPLSYHCVWLVKPLNGTGPLLRRSAIPKWYGAFFFTGLDWTHLTNLCRSRSIRLVEKKTHPLLHAVWLNFAATCTLTTAQNSENFKVTGQGYTTEVSDYLRQKFCVHDDSWTATLSLMIFCMNMYLDNCTNPIEYQGQGSRSFLLVHQSSPNCFHRTWKKSNSTWQGLMILFFLTLWLVSWTFSTEKLACNQQRGVRNSLV